MAFDLTTNDALDCKERFTPTFDALAQIVQELLAARETIVQQAAEIEQLRLKSTAALQVKSEAMIQVEKAIVIIGDSRSRAAQVEAALAEERAERARLAHELSVVTQHVGLLFDTLPTAQ